MKWLPNKAELLKRTMDNECQKTWKQRLAAWALVKARQEVGLEDGKCLKRWKEQHEQKYVDRNEHGVLQNMEESKSAVQKEEDSGSPGRHVQLKDCTPGCRARTPYCRETKGKHGQGWSSEKQHEVNVLCVPAKSLQSCPTLCDPIDGSPPGSPVPGILQARTLEWVAISFSNA